jgi:hypothetical protein
MQGDEQFYISAPFVVRPPAPPRRGVTHAGKLLVLAALAPLALVGYLVLRPAPSHTSPPRVLAPASPSAGMPESLAAAVRMQAESSRHVALQAVEQVTAERGTAAIADLAAAQPGLEWVTADQASTASKIVSIEQREGVATVAVSTPSREVCAFGRWSPGAVPEYVTIANVPQCRAVDAPVDGWTSEAGGAPSDLPDESQGESMPQDGFMP